MKKLLPIFLFALFFSPFLMAQVSLIPEIGLVSSSYKFEELFDQWYDAKRKTGYIVGAKVELPITGGLYLQPGLYYVEKGSFIESEIREPWYEEEVNGILYTIYDNYDETINYLQFPILLKYQFLGGSYRFHLTAGPELAWGLGGTSKTTLTDMDRKESLNGYFYNDIFEIDSEVKIDFGNSSSDQYERFDLGLSLGAGISFLTDAGQFIIDFRYVIGQKDMYGEDYDSDLIQYNNGMYLTIGYSVSLDGNY